VTYTILRPTGNYPARQAEANAAGCQLYLEQHMDASTNPYWSRCLGIAVRQEDYSLAMEYAVTCAERSPFNMDWAAEVRVSGQDGYGNLRRLNCPGILMEPGMISNLAYSRWVQTDDGILTLAGVIVHVVHGGLPHGGVVALSIGHAGKSEEDKGAPAAGGGWEAEISGRVINLAEALLMGDG